MDAGATQLNALISMALIGSWNGTGREPARGLQKQGEASYGNWHQPRVTGAVSDSWGICGSHISARRVVALNFSNKKKLELSSRKPPSTASVR